MEHLELYNKLTQYRKPNTDFWDALSEKVKTIKYDTKEILLDIDAIPQRIHFIKSGGMLGYRKHQGNWILVRIWKPGDMILHLDQAIDIRRSNIQIVAATSSITLELDHKEIENLKSKYADMRLYFNQLTVEEIRYWQDHSFWRQTATDAKERYSQSKELYGQLFINLTDKDKASYIGVSERWISGLK